MRCLSRRRGGGRRRRADCAIGSSRRQRPGGSSPGLRSRSRSASRSISPPSGSLRCGPRAPRAQARCSALRRPGDGAIRRSSRSASRRSRRASSSPRCVRTVSLTRSCASPAYGVSLSGFVERREERERSDRIVLRVNTIEGMRWAEKPGRVRISVRKGTAPAVGAFVTMKARLNPPLAPLRPGGYDFSRDLFFQGVGAGGFALGVIKPARRPLRRVCGCVVLPSSTGCARRSTGASARRSRAMRA